MSTFGRLMRAFRLKDGLSSKAMAKKLGTNKGYVSGIENDKTNPPSIKLLRRYFKAFEHHGIDFDDLVELAYVTKAPKNIRGRLLAAISNPLLKIEIVETPPKPAEPAKIQIRMPEKEAV